MVFPSKGAALPLLLARCQANLNAKVDGQIAGAGSPPNPTLVRHIYDLHVTREHYDAGEVAILARKVMRHDMVYGEEPGFAEAVATVAALADRLATRYSQ